MPSVMAVMNLTILPRISPQDSSIRNTTPPWTGLIQGINTPTTRETDHSPIMVLDIEYITADHSPATIHPKTEAAAIEDTPCVLLPATRAASYCPSANGCCCYSSHCKTDRYSHTPSLTCHFFCSYHSHHYTDWSWSHSSSSIHTTQESQPMKVKQFPRPPRPHTPNCPKAVTIQDYPSDSSDSHSDSDPLNC